MAEENLKTKLEDLITHSGELGETAMKLVQVKASRKTANLSASFLVKIILAILCLFIFLFCSMAIAWWLGIILNSIVLGFFIVGAFYLLLLIFVLLLKSKVLLPYFRDIVVKKIYE